MLSCLADAGVFGPGDVMLMATETSPFDAPVAEREPEGEPDAVAQDLGREALALVQRGDRCSQAASIAQTTHAGTDSST